MKCFGIAAIMLAASVCISPATAWTKPAPPSTPASKSTTAETGSVCDLGLVAYGMDKLPEIEAALRSQVAAKSCARGDILHVVAQDGLVWNFAALQLCDYSYLVLERDDSRLKSFSCVFSGSVKSVHQ